MLSIGVAEMNEPWSLFSRAHDKAGYPASCDSDAGRNVYSCNTIRYLGDRTRRNGRCNTKERRQGLCPHIEHLVCMLRAFVCPALTSPSLTSPDSPLRIHLYSPWRPDESTLKLKVRACDSNTAQPKRVTCTTETNGRWTVFW